MSSGGTSSSGTGGASVGRPTGAPSTTPGPLTTPATTGFRCFVAYKILTSTQYSALIVNGGISAEIPPFYDKESRLEDRLGQGLGFNGFCTKPTVTGLVTR
jgi:hypothetical protein